MENNNSLVVHNPTRQLTVGVWQMIEAIAPAMHQARFFGVSNKEQAAAIMIKGYELGLGLAASFELIQIVEGKPTLSPRGALALIYNSPVCEKVEIVDQVDTKGNPTGCRVTMKRRSGLEYSVTWTLEDAKRAGLVKPKGAWETYPANMLKWRAIGFCADVVFPDVLGGLKRADELGAEITPDGDVIEGSWMSSSPVEEEITAAIESGNGNKLNLSDLVAQYGAERVMEANGGKIPGTDEELETVAAALEVA